MRYIDSGDRDPVHALGTWLGAHVLGSGVVTALRIQSGFFGSGALGYFEAVLQNLAQTDGPAHLLIGSNGGETTEAAVLDLLRLAGPPRANRKVGVVSYQQGFFHPKVIHIERADGSAAAYVGSANVTLAGVGSQHVEAGLLVDSLDGDDPAVLLAIAEAIDAWFIEQRPGLYPVETPADVRALANLQVLNVPAPPRRPRSIKSGRVGTTGVGGASLYPLVAAPPVSSPATSVSVTPPPPPPTGPGPQAARARVLHWAKTLSAADAQRRAGHQSNAIALTQGHYRLRIDHKTYFREEFFADVGWSSDRSQTGELIEVAQVPMHVFIDGVDHGTLPFRLSYGSERHAGTNSPTTFLHLQPVAQVFAQEVMTGKTLSIELMSDGSYELNISGSSGV